MLPIPARTLFFWGCAHLLAFLLLGSASLALAQGTGQPPHIGARLPGLPAEFFPLPKRPVAPIVSSEWSTEESRDKDGEPEEYPEISRREARHDGCRSWGWQRLLHDPAVLAALGLQGAFWPRTSACLFGEPSGAGERAAFGQCNARAWRTARSAAAVPFCGPRPHGPYVPRGCPAIRPALQPFAGTPPRRARRRHRFGPANRAARHTASASALRVP